MFQFSKKLVLFLSLLLSYSVAQSSSLNIMGDGIGEVLGNNTSLCNCNNTYMPEPADSSESSLSTTSALFVGGAVTGVFTLAIDKILLPLLDRLSCYQACTQGLSRAWYSCKNYLSPCCRGICNPPSSETMDLDQVIARPRKGWCCFSQTRPGDFEESLHLLDRGLGITGWVKSPIIENDQFFRLVGFRYHQGNTWIAIIREYINTKVEPYELHPSLQEKSTYILQKKVEKMRSQIGGSRETEKKYFSLTAKGLEVMNDPRRSKSSSTLLEAREKAKELSDNFVNSLLPSSDLDAELAPVTVLRDRLQEILRSWKFEGATMEIDIDKKNAYLAAKPPFTRSNQLSVYFHKGIRDENASAASSSSSSSRASGE